MSADPGFGLMCDHAGIGCWVAPVLEGICPLHGSPLEEAGRCPACGGEWVATVTAGHMRAWRKEDTT